MDYKLIFLKKGNRTQLIGIEWVKNPQPFFKHPKPKPKKRR